MELLPRALLPSGKLSCLLGGACPSLRTSDIKLQVDQTKREIT